jgi:hypothetical protein
VETDFSMKHRFYNFCISCGMPANQNHDNNKDSSTQCMELKNGIFQRRIGIMTAYNRTANENQYTTKY